MVVELDDEAAPRSQVTGSVPEALDLLGLCDAADLPAREAAWIRVTIRSAVESICNPAVAALASDLRSRLAEAPDDVAHRIDQAGRRNEAGFA